MKARSDRGDSEEAAAGEGGRIRLDRWLFHARMFKTRTLAADRIAAGGIRLNGAPCRKPAQLVGAGDTVTVASGQWVRALRVLAPRTRRGPPAEAQSLYQDLSSQPLEAAPPRV